MIRDPGLQPERTSLAWTRTSLLMAANAYLVIRSGMKPHRPAILVLGIVLALVAAAMWLFATYRDRQLATAVAAPSVTFMALTSAGVCIGALASAVALSG